MTTARNQTQLTEMTTEELETACGGWVDPNAPPAEPSTEVTLRVSSSIYWWYGRGYATADGI